MFPSRGRLTLAGRADWTGSEFTNLKLWSRVKTPSTGSFRPEGLDGCSRSSLSAFSHA